jgi:uncharacterized protein (TIGR03067 family)
MAAGLAPEPARVAQPGSDTQQVQGTWQLVTLEGNVRQIVSFSLKDLLNARLVIDGKRWKYKLGKTRLRMVYRLDPWKDPKKLDLTITAGPARGKIFQAIYALHGDILKICHHRLPGNERPADFETAADGEYLVTIWKLKQP